MPRDRWKALVRGEGCLVCEEVTGPGRDNSEGFFVMERLAVAMIADARGWTVENNDAILRQMNLVFPLSDPELHALVACFLTER
jgi:hypothetical protein